MEGLKVHTSVRVFAICWCNLGLEFVLFLRLRIEIEANNKPSRLSTTLCVYRSSVRFGLVRSARLSGRITMAIVNRVTGGFGQGAGRGGQSRKRRVGRPDHEQCSPPIWRYCSCCCCSFFTFFDFFDGLGVITPWHSMWVIRQVTGQTAEEGGGGRGGLQWSLARHWDRPRPLISLRQVQNVRRNCLLNKLTHSGTRVIYSALRDDLRSCKNYKYLTD